MKLINETKWNTEDLRKLVKQVLVRAGVGTRGYRVTITKAKEHYSGLGWYGQSRILVRVPPTTVVAYVCGDDGKTTEEVMQRAFNSETFARVANHEIDHNRGLHHGDMVEMENIDVSWARNFVVRPKEEKVKSKEDIKSKRYRRVLELIADKEAKVKRLQNALKKLLKKRNYYEKELESREASTDAA